MKLYNLLVSFISIVNGHMFMKYPFARRSKYSDYYVQNNLIDYNLDAPLYTQDFGFTFPCKGFPTGPTTLTIQTNKINIEIAGTAPHEGGHCQFGISYDNKNFIVLKQVIGTCLKNNERNYMIDLPLSLPNDNFIIFWTWINAIGNREYYMDCADIRINLNTQNPSYVIEGKELVIVNIPGYKIIPEFPYPDMYDGRELLLQSKTFQINICNNCNNQITTIPQPTIYTTSSTKSTSTPPGITSTQTQFTTTSFRTQVPVTGNFPTQTKILDTTTFPTQTQITDTTIFPTQTQVPYTQQYTTTTPNSFTTKTTSFIPITNSTKYPENGNTQVVNSNSVIIIGNILLVILLIVSGYFLI
jgi:hypothetical protein